MIVQKSVNLRAKCSAKPSFCIFANIFAYPSSEKDYNVWQSLVCPSRILPCRISIYPVMNHIFLRCLVRTFLVLVCLRNPLFAQQSEPTPQKSSSATMHLGLDSIKLPNVTFPTVTLPSITLPNITLPSISLPTIDISSITISTVTGGSIEATLSKFFQFSSETFAPDSLSKMFKPFTVFAPDTNRSEYAGFYTHFTFGGGLSGFGQELGFYPNMINIASPLAISTTRAEHRTASVGIVTDTPILLPLFRSRRRSQATGFRWGMNIEFQASDARLFGTSSQARFDNGGAVTTTFGNVQHGGFLTLSSLAFAPTLRYAFSSGLSLQAGLRLGLVFSSTWTVEDSVVSPSGARLLQTDATMRRELQTGRQITGFSLNPISIMAGIGYTIAVDRSFHLRPEIILSIPFGDANWSNRTSLRAGLSVLINTERIIPTPDTTFARDTSTIVVGSNEITRTLLKRSNTVVQPSEYPNDEPAKVFITEHYERRIAKPKPLLSASVDAEFILQNGQRRRSAVVEAEKTVVSLIPILPSALEHDSASSASIYRHYEELQRYFADYNLRFRSRREISISSSSGTILTDTVLLAAALPHIAFTPRVVSEAELRGFDLSLWRLSQNGKERRIGFFSDTSSTLIPKPFLWKPADAPELFIRPDERFTYRFSVFDEDNTEIPADSGFISLRADIRGNLASQAIKRNTTIYALSPTLWALYETKPELANVITAQTGSRVRLVTTVNHCDDALLKTDTERLLGFLRKHPALGNIPIEYAPCSDRPTTPAKKMRESDRLPRTREFAYLFVVVER